MEEALPGIASQAVKAAGALSEFVRRQASQGGKQALFDDEDDGAVVNLVLALRKAPRREKVCPRRLPVPRELLPEDAELCLFVKDEGDEGEAAALEKLEALRQAGQAHGVVKVMGVTRLKKDYKQFEARRALLKRYDMFLADERVVTVLPRLLGSKFFKAKKQPVPLKLAKKQDWGPIFKQAREGAYLHLAGGSCSLIHVGRASWPAKHVAANAMAALQGAVPHLPGKWRGLQAVFLKTSDSMALPIYATDALADKELAEIAGAEESEEGAPAKGKAKGKRKAAAESDEKATKAGGKKKRRQAAAK
uniref:Uncharacterized protein n=1 Tax=Prasinoderma singulare TaxID=676789 RepID=A0A7S3C0E6_9VIRI|mmetsp:Transcript_6649/g.20122  ORF Transcript_6649/g.20122 Transcript_6649/m.20122 type:complete len:306 (+) Transcript_6649:131-1048(+)